MIHVWLFVLVFTPQTCWPASSEDLLRDAKRGGVLLCLDADRLCVLTNVNIFAHARVHTTGRESYICCSNIASKQRYSQAQ